MKTPVTTDKGEIVLVDFIPRGLYYGSYHRRMLLSQPQTQTPTRPEDKSFWTEWLGKEVPDDKYYIGYDDGMPSFGLHPDQTEYAIPKPVEEDLWEEAKGIVKKMRTLYLNKYKKSLNAGEQSAYMQQANCYTITMEVLEIFKQSYHLTKK